ncbi:TRna (tRNA) Methyltransferase, partial [Trichostrongylus colubriformis]
MEIESHKTTEDVVDSGNSEGDVEMATRDFDQDRVHITPLPKFFGFKQFKKLLEKHLSGISIRKIRQMKFDAYVSFNSADDAQVAISRLNGLEVKKTVLRAQLAQSDQKNILRKNAQSFQVKTARESVTKLADVPYDEQLLQKTRASQKTCERLIAEMRRANVDDVDALLPSNLLKKIKPSPKTTGYRNKCEFTIGLTHEGKVCVGFVGGRFSNNEHYVIPIGDVDNVTEMTKKVVEAVTNFVQVSGLPPFDEFSRTGFWKMLTVRQFGGDVMLILTANPSEDPCQEEKLKQEFCSRFLNSSTFLEDGFRVTSIYWHSLANCSDQVEYEHIGGVPYIYESVLGCRFRVSPSAFFQTNSQAAAVLYTTVGEACGLTSLAVSVEKEERHSEGSESERSKRPRLDESANGTTKSNDIISADGPQGADASNGVKTRPTILLDICCGTGTIGQCILKEFKKDNKVFCIGIDIIEAAIVDAKENAKSNGLGDD